MDWQSGNSQTLSGYKFTYDGLNRLTSVIYGEGIEYYTNLNRFNEFIDQYDLNGNIKRLRQYGKLRENSYDLLDDLTLSYNGNQLKNIEDAASDPLYYGVCNFMDAPKNREKEYFYDGNGCLTQDYNKGIAFIKYNRLNQPSTMQFKDEHMIQYQYDSNGMKVGSTYTTAIPGIIIPMGGRTGEDEDYLYPQEMSTIQDNSYYHNLVDYGNKFTISTPEGYITFKLKGTNRYSSTYHYYLKDHQGNNRVVVNQDGRTVEQINHYYPFGGSFGDELDVSDDQPFKFSGKELDKMYGLDWYDFGARPYDRSSGCFPSTMDPLCEKYYSISPYVYCANNPMRYIDLHGDSISVAEEYQLQFMFDMQKVFGNKTSFLSFNANGNLVLEGKTKKFTEGMTKSQKNVFNGLNKVMSDKQVTSVVYADNYNLTVSGKAKTVDIINEFGGGVYSKVDNVIVVAPNVGNVSVTTDPQIDKYGNFISLGGKSMVVTQNSTSALFHEIGEVLNGGLTKRGGVITYENYARNILKMPLRPTDLNHTNSINTIFK